ncbi:MAG TPA: hypothetical protein VGL49_07475 [Acidimicrobiales bacterium]
MVVSLLPWRRPGRAIGAGLLGLVLAGATATATPAATTAAIPAALLLNRKWITPGTVNTTPYNHYSALRTYEDLLGITTGGSDGHGHLGMAGMPGLAPFDPDVFNRRD